MDLKLYTVDTTYIEFLRANKIENVFENKDSASSFIRKYLGVVINIGEYKYYVPLSSPKDTGYTIINGSKVIRKSIIPIIRIISDDEHGTPELKGTLKFSNMIPVPDNSITYYDIGQETDNDYKILVQKEYDFIKKNQKNILKNASVLYKQKTKDLELFPKGEKRPGYLDHVVDFKYAEQMHDKYIQK